MGDQARTEEYWTGVVNVGLLAAGFQCISKMEPVGFAGISFGLRERGVQDEAEDFGLSKWKNRGTIG